MNMNMNMKMFDIFAWKMNNFLLAAHDILKFVTYADSISHCSETGMLLKLQWR